MKTKTVYIASDGSEHESPQEAAEQDLEMALWPLIERGASKIENMRVTEGYDLYAVTREVVEELARNPEALRAALNTYFEALEEHPDLGCDPAYFDDMVRYGRGVVRIDPEDLAAPQEPPHPSGLVLTDKARNYTGIGTSHTVYDWLAQGWTPEQLVEQGIAVKLKDGETGDPDDPTTWRADLPVDHPDYYRPFGTRED